MQVDDVSAHTIQEVLRVRNEHEDSLETDKKGEKKPQAAQCIYLYIYLSISLSDSGI